MTMDDMDAPAQPMPDLGSVSERVSAFRSDLAKFDVSTLVQRHVTTGPTFVLNDKDYHSLRAKVASQFGLHANEVLVVGSGKLGFSLVGKKRYRPFGDESDIDVAVVSSALFDKYAQATFDYWRISRYWARYDDHLKYQFRGWIRPDYLPSALEMGQAWWDFFRRLTSEGTFGPYQIRGGLYKSWHYLDSYHSICIEECKRSDSV